MESYGIHWFRRDLRIAGNQALKWNWKKQDGRVIGLFCFDQSFLSREDFSVNRFQFFMKTMESLKKELQACGSDLLVVDALPMDFFPQLFQDLKSQGIDLPSSITWSKDYEPFSHERDKKVKELLQSHTIEVKNFRDHLLIEPEELNKPDGTGYQVYSPFARKWLEIFQSDEIQKRMSPQKKALEFLASASQDQFPEIFSFNWRKLFSEKLPYEDQLNHFLEQNGKRVTVPIPDAGSKAVMEALEEFEPSLDQYGEQRDFPATKGTSGFSFFLKNGSLTVPMIIEYFQLKPYKKKIHSRDNFFSELIWREFYYHILHRHPRVEAESFLPVYKDLDWQNNPDWLEAWKEGKTGFPIVDAGMRELKTTGWMHNRVRMIVASFLTKDLLIDWRLGEAHFMHQLLDGDLAPNNGGWQWAASTGCDPQPYFRIFNPWSQSKKFDPNGDYIQKYIPELKDLPAKELHEPILDHATYPKPIVDHKVQRELALEMYKSSREK